jgi:hypothetical protein
MQKEWHLATKPLYFSPHTLWYRNWFQLSTILKQVFLANFCLG